jgi:hypothetical protein
MDFGDGRLQAVDLPKTEAFARIVIQRLLIVTVVAEDVILQASLIMCNFK